MSDIASVLESIVGAEAVQTAEQQTSRWQTAILYETAKPNGRSTESAQPSCLVFPADIDSLVEVMRCAHSENWRVMACGHGSKLTWGGQVRAVDVVISTERLNQIVQHAVGDLTVTVQAGVPFAALQNTLRQANQFLPLDPAYPEQATVGGIVATADAGSWRQRYGGVRDLLIGISLVRYDGQTAKAGGKVVKNVAGYDLMKLMTGSYGTLGILSELTFRTYPWLDDSATVVLAGKLDALAQAASEIRASVLTPTMFDWLSTQFMQSLDLDDNPGLAIRFQSIPESITEQCDRILKLSSEMSIKTHLITDEAETDLWDGIQAQIWPTDPDLTDHCTCKIGLLPSAIMSLLQQLDTWTEQPYWGRIHASSGIGTLRFAMSADTEKSMIELLKNVRSHCESASGYLTILEAPPSIKSAIDIWGYTGNALSLMQGISHQFDPDQRLSPGRMFTQPSAR
ncbi:MAG: FAD-binding oxidoreductase [Thainema sp.]